DADADPARHLGVIDGRPHHRAHPSPLQNQPENHGHSPGHRNDEESIDRKIELTDRVGAGEHCRHRNRVRVATPRDEREVLEDQAKPIVVSTWPSSCPESRLRKAFHSPIPMTAMARAPSRIASGKLFGRPITVSPTYPPSK